MKTVDELYAEWKQAEQHTYDLQHERDAFLVDIRARQIAARAELIVAEKAYLNAQLAQTLLDSEDGPDYQMAERLSVVNELRERAE